MPTTVNGFFALILVLLGASLIASTLICFFGGIYPGFLVDLKNRRRILMGNCKLLLKVFMVGIFLTFCSEIIIRFSL